MAWSNSIAYGAKPDGAVVHMNLADVDSDAVIVATEHGAATAGVVADATVRAGVVSMTHGRSAENPGALTSETSDVDDLTAMPRVAGLGVRVTPAPQPPS
jgi:hypothetical protein